MSNSSTLQPKVFSTENSNEYRPISERLRNAIVNDLLISMARWPEQSRTVRESETARIARKHKVTNLQVGGVRSNLSRGAYGNFNSMLKAHRKTLSSS